MSNPIRHGLELRWCWDGPQHPFCDTTWTLGSVGSEVPSVLGVEQAAGHPGQFRAGRDVSVPLSPPIFLGHQEGVMNGREWLGGAFRPIHGVCRKGSHNLYCRTGHNSPLPKQKTIGTAVNGDCRCQIYSVITAHAQYI